MGIIQNAINQIIGTVGLAARLSPEYKTKQELYKLGKQEKALSSQQELLPSIASTELEEGKTIAAKQHKEILKKQAKVAQKRFELNPTKDTMRKAVLPADTNELRMVQANIKAAQKSETKQKTRRNFMNYLKNIEIQGGGKVGDLPKHVQKQIASQYPKEKRKQLMDLMDKEKKNGNK